MQCRQAGKGARAGAERHPAAAAVADAARCPALHCLPPNRCCMWATASPTPATTRPRATAAPSCGWQTPRRRVSGAWVVVAAGGGGRGGDARCGVAASRTRCSLPCCSAPASRTHIKPPPTCPPLAPQTSSSSSCWPTSARSRATRRLISSRAVAPAAPPPAAPPARRRHVL